MGEVFDVSGKYLLVEVDAKGSRCPPCWWPDKRTAGSRCPPCWWPDKMTAVDGTGEPVPPPGPKPGPKPGSPFFPLTTCKTDKDCKAGEVCVAGTGFLTECVP